MGYYRFMRHIKLPFAGSEVEFVDREAGLRQFENWAERGTRFPIVVFGPEGCGKTALLRQAMEVLREHGYSVVLASPLADRPEERLALTEELRGLARDALSVILGEPTARLIDAAIELLYRAVKANVGRKIALLLDDVFQAVGVSKAALLVKRLLNMIEYPSERYESIVVVIATSDGMTKSEIGRHEWSTLMPMWNMPQDGFRELYEQLPGQKPPFDEVWRWTGGNPRILDRLYAAGWSVDDVVYDIARKKELTKLIATLTPSKAEALKRAVEDPDTLLTGRQTTLLRELVRRNLVVDNLYRREAKYWLDAPPPEKEPELGIGREVAWQTPLHKEAVRKALEGL